MGIVFGFLAPVLVLALLGLVAAGVVGFQRGHLTLATIVHVYTALVLGICIILTLSGGALLLKALASAAIAPDFSYQTAEYPRGTPPPGVVEPPRPSAAEHAATQAADDLTAGLTLLVLGGVLGVLHSLGKAAAARHDTDHAGAIERGYAVGLLLVGTAVGLTSGTLLLNDLLRRYVVTTAAAPPYAQPHPGGALGFALTFVPLWAYFGRRAWHLLVAMPRGPR